MDRLSGVPMKLKYAILDFVPPTAATATATAPVVAPVQTEAPKAAPVPKRTPLSSEARGKASEVLAALSSKGFWTTPAAFSETVATGTFAGAKEIVEKRLEEGWKPAGVGTGALQRLDTKSRGDYITWLDTASPPEGLREAVDGIKALGDSLAELSGVRFTKCSMQLAYYPPAGVGYVKHRDARLDSVTDGSESRRITILYYLNANWEDAHGGCLRIFPWSRDPALVESDADSPDVREQKAADRSKDAATVEPRLNTMLVFNSDCEHEVLPPTAPRMAITAWFYATRQPCPFSRTALTSASSAHVPLRFRGDYQANDRIFVSVVSYRDPECQRTVASLFATAANPARLRVGVVQQLRLPEDAQTCLVHNWSHPEQVREIRLPHTMATGPCLARFVCVFLCSSLKQTPSSAALFGGALLPPA
eukprot:TRINITY_DN7465_c0_g1_i1.p1 TRINITY_DN7465_c0_g1~~TRINITY_DN7465_c0_g1_i1.p1  ORF type:complete len:421 (+),score=50.27 TRINITY_DN7465_c0_g1_i1:34-1296(+)